MFTDGVVETKLPMEAAGGAGAPSSSSAATRSAASLDLLAAPGDRALRLRPAMKRDATPGLEQQRPRSEQGLHDEHDEHGQHGQPLPDQPGQPAPALPQRERLRRSRQCGRDPDQRAVRRHKEPAAGHQRQQVDQQQVDHQQQRVDHQHQQVDHQQQQVDHQQQQVDHQQQQVDHQRRRVDQQQHVADQQQQAVHEQPQQEPVRQQHQLVGQEQEVGPVDQDGGVPAGCQHQEQQLPGGGRSLAERVQPGECRECPGCGRVEHSQPAGPQGAAMGRAEPPQASRHEVQPLVAGGPEGRPWAADSAASAASKKGGTLPLPLLPPPPPLLPQPAPKRFSPLFRQVLAAAGPVMATVSSGMTTGYSAVLLPQLRDPNSTIYISNTNQESWIASMAPLPMALGCLLSGLMLDRLGRRRSQLFICLPFAVGWVMLAVARDLFAILGGRFLTGLCVGLVGPPSLIYIGETAGPQYRGLLLAAISLAVAVGILAAHVLGSLLHWRMTAWACAAAPLACVALLCPSPESPVWLASKGRLDEAARAFRWLRGFDEAATLELQGLLAKHGPVAAPAGAAASPRAGEATAGLAALPLYRQIFHRTFLKPFFVITIFFFIMQFSGVNAVAFYTVSIMKDVGGVLDEYVATIMLDVVRTLVSCVACVLLRRVGRRPLAVFSAAAAGVALLGLSALLAFGDPGRHPWMPTALLVAYITAVSLGLVPLPWVMSGEVFPSNLRGLGGGSTSACAFLFFFAVVKTGPGLFLWLGRAGTFAAYGSVALVGSVFLLAFLPETKNRTLQEIEDDMAGLRPAHKKGVDDEV